MNKQLAKEFLEARKADGDYELVADGIDLILGGGKARYLITWYKRDRYFVVPVFGESRELDTFGYNTYSEHQLLPAIRKFESELAKAVNAPMTDREFVIERRKFPLDKTEESCGWVVGDAAGVHYKLWGYHPGGDIKRIECCTVQEGLNILHDFDETEMTHTAALDLIRNWEAKVMGETPSVGGDAVEDVKPVQKEKPTMTDREFVIERRKIIRAGVPIDGYTVGDPDDCHYRLEARDGLTPHDLMNFRRFETPEKVAVYCCPVGCEERLIGTVETIRPAKDLTKLIVDWEAKVMGETPSVGGDAVVADPTTYAEFVKRRGGAELVKGENSDEDTIYGNVDGLHYQVVVNFEHKEQSFVYLYVNGVEVDFRDDPFLDSYPHDEILDRIKEAEAAVTNPFDAGKTLTEAAEACRVAGEAMNMPNQVEIKPSLSRLPYEPLAQIALVLQHGDSKYPKDGWKGSFPWSRSTDKAMRHLHKWNNGEDKDPESGLSHLAHAVANLMFLLYYEVNGSGEDDR